MPDPETASGEEVEAERIRVARAYADCRQRHADLVTFVKGDPPAPAPRRSPLAWLGV